MILNKLFSLLTKSNELSYGFSNLLAQLRNIYLTWGGANGDKLGEEAVNIADGLWSPTLDIFSKISLTSPTRITSSWFFTAM